VARRLALIAHDNKKVDLVAWATFNRKTLANLKTADLIITALAPHAALGDGTEEAA
jgi:methylglyoxal synthase